MNFHLKGLRLTEDSMVAAEFNVDGEIVPVVTVFEVCEGEIPTASASPDVFVEFNGSADEMRRIVAAVLAFFRASF